MSGQIGKKKTKETNTVFKDEDYCEPVNLSVKIPNVFQKQETH